MTGCIVPTVNAAFSLSQMYNSIFLLTDGNGRKEIVKKWREDIRKDENDNE